MGRSLYAQKLRRWRANGVPALSLRPASHGAHRRRAPGEISAGVGSRADEERAGASAGGAGIGSDAETAARYWPRVIGRPGPVIRCRTQRLGLDRGCRGQSIAGALASREDRNSAPASLYAADISSCVARASSRHCSARTRYRLEFMPRATPAEPAQVTASAARSRGGCRDRRTTGQTRNTPCGDGCKQRGRIP